MKKTLLFLLVLVSLSAAAALTFLVANKGLARLEPWMFWAAAVLFGFSSVGWMGLSLRCILFSDRLSAGKKGALMGSLFCLYAALFSGLAIFWGLPGFFALGIFFPAVVTYIGFGSTAHLLPLAAEQYNSAFFLGFFGFGVFFQMIVGGLAGSVLASAAKCFRYAWIED